MFKLSTGANISMNVSKRDIDYNPNQIQQFTQIQEPELPEFLYHLDEASRIPIPIFCYDKSL